MSVRAVPRSRDRIVAAATALLDAGEPDDITISGLARRAGVTRPTFYAAFGDLPTLYAEAAAARVSATFTHLRSEPDDPTGPADVMESAILRVLQELEPHAAFFRRVLTAHGGHLVQERINELVARDLLQHSPLAPLLADGPLPGDRTARMLASAIAWDMLAWFGSEDREPAPRLAAHLSDFLHHSVVGGLAGVHPERTPA